MFGNIPICKGPRKSLEGGRQLKHPEFRVWFAETLIELHKLLVAKMKKYSDPFSRIINKSYYSAKVQRVEWKDLKHMYDLSRRRILRIANRVFAVCRDKDDIVWTPTNSSVFYKTPIDERTAYHNKLKNKLMEAMNKGERLDVKNEHVMSSIQNTIQFENEQILVGRLDRRSRLSMIQDH